MAGVRPGRWTVLAIYAVATVAAVGVAKNYTYTGSFDMALHYDLVRSIYKSWVWPTLGKPLATVMELYPPLAHYLGAIVGVFVGSPLLGMYAVAAGSMFGCYVLLTRALSLGSLRSTGVSLAVAVIGLALGRTQHAVEGFQTIYNYFYAHMVGDFLFLAFAAWLTRTGLDWRWRLGITAVSVAVLGWLYLLTAIQVALTYLALEGWLLLRAVIAQRGLRLKQLAPLFLGLVVLPPVIALHPKFRFMTSVAGNDGALPLGVLDHYVPAISLGLVILSLVLAAWPTESVRWRRGALFLATAGGASGAAALAQYAALLLVKAGSAYAVKKYGFANVTLLIFCLAALTGMFVDRRREVEDNPVSGAVLACLAGMAALWLLPVSNTPDRVDKFAKYQRAVSKFLASGQLPPGLAGHIVSKNSHYHLALNHAETMVDMAMDPNTSLVADMKGVDIGDANPAPYAYMVDTSGAFPPQCTVPGSRYTDVVLAKISCVQNWPIAFNAPLVLSQMKFLPASFAEGWSGNEGTGVWTLGKRTVFKLHLDNPPPTVRLTFTGPAYIPNKAYVQHVQVSVGGVPVGSRVFTADKPDGDVTAVIPAALFKNGDADVVLDLPDATSPADQKLSGDVRVIALFVTKITLDK